MGKAIFVLDEMPKACQSGYTKERLDCPLFHDDYYCMGAYKNVIKNFDGICDEARPDWCPLKELPDGVVSTSNEINYDEGFFDGWNSFRRRILGEET